MFTPVCNFPGLPLVGPKTFHVANALTGTPKLIYSDERLVRGVRFVPKKANGSANTGTVTIQIKNDAGVFTDAYDIATDDQPLNWPTSEKGEPFNLNQFKLKVASANDGVQVIYEN